MVHVVHLLHVQKHKVSKKNLHDFFLFQRGWIIWIINDFRDEISISGLLSNSCGLELGTTACGPCGRNRNNSVFYAQWVRWKTILVRPVIQRKDASVGCWWWYISMWALKWATSQKQCECHTKRQCPAVCFVCNLCVAYVVYVICM